MKCNIEKRLQSLEAKAKPTVIAILADLVKWYADDEDTEIELSPELQALVDETLKCIEEERLTYNLFPLVREMRFQHILPLQKRNVF